MPRAVSFIPSQTPDEASFTSSRAALQSPWVQLYNDAITLFSNIRYVPNVFLPMKQAPPMLGVTQRKNLVFRDDTLNTICVAVQIIITVISPIILLLPGWGIIIFTWVMCMLVYVWVQPMWGSLIVQSNINLGEPKRFGKEKWFFINGIATSHESLQLTCDRLAATFKRPVTGIHNRSFGMIADVVECMIQRCFSYTTMDVRCCFEVLKLAVLDPEVEKVVAIAHSQGGIIISLTLDRMLAELPTCALNKMEIYTFGSAASHFNNPLTNPTTSSPPTTTPTRPTNVFSTIEHYANEFDMVPRWGVLHATRDLTLQRYAGRVFVNIGASGHLFNDHYLEPMFPASSVLSASTDASPSSSLELEKTASDANMAPRPGLSPFLDRIVDVDFNTALRRAQTVDDSKDMGFLTSPAAGEAQAGARRGQQFGARPSVKDETQSAIGEGAGRTVRQLSKLWMYVGGGEPRGRQ